MMNLFEFGVNIVEDLIIVSFLTMYFGCKYKGLKAVGGFICGVASMLLFLTYVNVLYKYEAFLGIVFVLIYFLYCHIFLKGDAKTKLFVAGFINCIVYSIAMFSQICTSILLKADISQIYSMSFVRIVQIAISKILLIGICVVLLRFRFECVAKRSNMVLFILMPIITEISTVGIMQVFLKHDELKNELFLTAIGIMLMNVLIYYVFIKTNKSIEIEAENKMIRQKMENDKKYAKDVEKLYNKTCAIKHDLIIHFEVILGLLENGTESAKNYIQNVMHKNNDIMRNMINTGNTCFDAIVNAKIALCDQYAISSEIHVANSTLNSLSSDEIAILFGNLFDNAIEASKNSKRKIIKLDVQIQDQYLSVCMRNSIDKSVLKENKTLETTKNDREMHGFGVKNIKAIVDHHQGMMSYSEESGYFVCDILIPTHLG